MESAINGSVRSARSARVVRQAPVETQELLSALEFLQMALGDAQRELTALDNRRREVAGNIRRIRQPIANYNRAVFKLIESAKKESAR